MSTVAKLRNTFIAGLLIFLPLGLTVYVLFITFSFVDNILKPLIEAALGQYIPGTGIVTIILLIFILGFSVRVALGRKVLSRLEEVIERVPILRTVYSVVKYASETVFIQEGSEFKGVVLLEYPRKDLYTIGFTTGTMVREIQDLTEENIINVFVPTAPNPTSGYVVQIPEKDVKYLRMSVEDGLKLILSGGFLKQ